MNDDSEKLKQILAEQQASQAEQQHKGITTANASDKKTSTIITVALIASIVSAFTITALSQHIQSATPSEPDDSFSDATTKNIDYDFIKMENRGQNLVYSPLSIKNGLALLYAGAAGNTKTQIENVLGDVAILGKASRITDKFSLANAIFIRDTFEKSVYNSYLKKVEDSYDAEIIYDDFANSSKINQWVSDKTFGLIDNLNLNISSDTRMALINALAIQLDWLHPFDSAGTSGESFENNKGEETIVTTMVQTTHAEDVRYYMDDELTLVAMPLELAGDAELEFVAIMPSGDLSAYVDSVSTSSIIDKLSLSNAANLSEGGLQIYIPKFKFDYELDFVKDLMTLGITDAFSSEVANFSSMASAPLYVSDASHQANIDFSEKGIKAAAVTALGMATTAMPRPDTSDPVVLRINRPFFFVIHDRNNNTTWFTGTVYQPNLWTNDEASYKSARH